MRESVIESLKELSIVSNTSFEELLNDALNFKSKYDLTDSSMEKFVRLNLSFYSKDEVPKENIFKLMDNLHSELENASTRKEVIQTLEEYKSNLKTTRIR